MGTQKSAVSEPGGQHGMLKVVLWWPVMTLLVGSTLVTQASESRGVLKPLVHCTKMESAGDSPGLGGVYHGELILPPHSL